MPNIACITRAPPGPPISTSISLGAICQERPKRSSSQPHRTSLPPPASSACHSRSISAWSSQPTEIEAAGVSRSLGPPFSAWNGRPASVNVTMTTSPAFPDGQSTGEGMTVSIREPGRSET